MRFSSIALAATTAAALTIAATTGAHADVKIVAKTAVTGATGAMAQRMGSSDLTTTTFYKGAKVRTENGKSVTIYDAATDKLYTLDASAKTYTVTSIRATQDAINPMMANMQMETVARVTPGGKTKTIMGKPARNYTWTASIAMKMKNGAMPKNSGANGLGAAPPAAPMMTISLRGEQWTTDAVKLPARPGSTSTSALMANLGNRMPGMKPLMTEMAKVKGLPLESTTTQSFSGMAMPGAPQKPIVTTTKAVSVSEAPLPASLFSVPAGYKMVKAATPGAMGGGRRAGMGMGGAMGRP